MTIFERISDGLQTISKGDIIRLSTKPAVLGRVSSQAGQGQSAAACCRLSPCAPQRVLPLFAVACCTTLAALVLSSECGVS